MISRGVDFGEDLWFLNCVSQIHGAFHAPQGHSSQHIC